MGTVRPVMPLPKAADIGTYARRRVAAMGNANSRRAITTGPHEGYVTRVMAVSLPSAK
jgi:hypothetical protein